MKRRALQFSEPPQAILDGYRRDASSNTQPQPTTIWYADASDSGKWVAGPSRKGSAELRKTSSWISCPYGKSGESILLADESGTPFASAVVVGVRIQRLQSLSEPTPAPRARWRSIIRRLLPGVPLQTAFALNWCERYGTHAWAANPGSG